LGKVEPLGFRKELVMKPNIEYIRKEMARRKWTGSQLAMKMGISRMEVSRLLRGKRVGGKKCIGGLIKAFPSADFNDLFFLD
jgi:transcriptional regulator with XRE-family HTH domain